MTFVKKGATVLVLVGLIVFASASSDRDQQVTVKGYGTISGRIVAEKSDTALTYANIVIIGTNKGAMSLDDGRFVIQGIPAGTYTVKAMMMGYKTIELRGVVVRPNETTEITFRLIETIVAETQVIEVTGKRKRIDVTSSSVYSSVTQAPVDALANKTGIVKSGDELHARGGRSGEIQMQLDGTPVNDPLANTRKRPPRPLVPQTNIRRQSGQFTTETYDRIYENEFLAVMDNPVSTFSIDVDAASYSNVRRFISTQALPPPDAVRIEELINYFRYDYPEPDDSHPFSITAEVAPCPWNVANKLVHVGLQGKRMDLQDLPPSNLVFLLDVSGSMRPANKLPLLKKAFRLLAGELRPNDRVAIVVYAGSSGLVLPSTPGDHKATILEAIDRLHAGGSTAGAAGIRLAYQVAQDNLLAGGNNRVILATDGDFNVGVSSDGELVRLIEEKRETGIFLTVLGFGTGNLRGSRMEKLADKGNGHYAYIDNILEAKKVLVQEIGATLLAIAKDVKIQIEFNPAKVKSYRLIGYENRLLKKEDFDDDKKDAGELGAGHSVTALYEIVPAVKSALRPNEYRYVQVSVDPGAYKSPDVLTVRFRYKPPKEDESLLIVKRVSGWKTEFDDASVDLRFSAAVAGFGMLLRGSKFKGEATFGNVLEMAKDAKGHDAEGYRAEFIRLVETCALLAKER